MLKIFNNILKIIYNYKLSNDTILKDLLDFEDLTRLNIEILKTIPKTFEDVYEEVYKLYYNQLDIEDLKQVYKNETRKYLSDYLQDKLTKEQFTLLIFNLIALYKTQYEDFNIEELSEYYKSFNYDNIEELKIDITNNEIEELNNNKKLTKTIQDGYYFRIDNNFNLIPSSKTLTFKNYLTTIKS